MEDEIKLYGYIWWKGTKYYLIDKETFHLAEKDMDPEKRADMGIRGYDKVYLNDGQEYFILSRELFPKDMQVEKEGSDD